jgi:aerobic-type carbon monoxide dehydrogenase small subunit (CoxS/CutS family)
VKALLAEDPDPNDEAIARALGGNLCRCGCYLKIADAVRRCGSRRGGRGRPRAHRLRAEGA